MSSPAVSRTVLLIATLDTKGAEVAYVRDLVERAGYRAMVLDAGVLWDPPFPPDIAAHAVAEAGGGTLQALRVQGNRSSALDVMARGATAIVSELHRAGSIDAVLGLGGSCGTAIASAAMRALPIGVPKVMVSTVASGQVAPYVGVTDMTMMYPVVDIAGLNRISRQVLTNAAGAVCGMLSQRRPDAVDRPIIAATMFGVTTPCVERIRERCEASGFEVVVFHANGSGGRAMEELIRAGFIAGVADVTTTEWADELVGGTLSAGPTRLDAAIETATPQVVSVGALDMVNFGPRDTVPNRFRHRQLYAHTPSVTLMRTTPAECVALGTTIAHKLNAAVAPTTVFLPLRGVSAIDRAAQPFADRAADAALFDAIRRELAPSVACVELDLHINDPEFADAMANRLLHDVRRHVASHASQQTHAIHSS